MTYEYECGPCKGYYEIQMTLAEYEQILSGDVPPPGCPKCGESLKKIITKAPSFKLLGNGWYDQDYAITDMEIDKNLDDEKRIEGMAHKDQERISNIGEV